MRLITIILTLSILVSCNLQKDPSYDKEAIALNNQAVGLLFKYPDSALKLLDMATDIDQMYYVAYSNKITIYCYEGNYEKATVACEKAVLAKPDVAEGVTLLGMLYDYTGQQDKAKDQYQTAIELFDKRIRASEKDNYANRLNRTLVLLLLGLEIEGQKEVHVLLQENPEDWLVQMLVEFDKVEYLDEILNQGKQTELRRKLELEAISPAGVSLPTPTD